eukprot:Em0005g12a
MPAIRVSSEPDQRDALQVPQDEEDKEATLQDEWLKQSRTVPGAQTLHSFVSVTTCTVKAKPFSSNKYSRNENVVLAAISQPCLYNYTIDGTQTVIVNQSSPVCLICSNTAFDKWLVGSLYPGIAGAPYIFYVEFPVATLLSVLQVGCYSSPGQEDIISSTIGVAVPVIPHVVTYVNETDHLTLVSSNVITATPSVIALSGRSWLDPKGSSIRLLASPAGIITGLVPFVNRTAAGNYTCVARLVANANGVTTVTGTTLVVVYYPPTVLSPQPTVYMVQGRTIQLNCTFDGLPAPNVIWTHPNGSVITSQSRFTIQTTSTSSSLTITSLVGGGDTGTYTCRATNFRGVSSNTVQLFVQVPPDPPTNVMVTSVGNSSLSLSWTNGFDGFSPPSNVVISYEVDRYPQEGTQAQTFPMGTSATLVGLHPYSNYTLHVSLTNAVGFISNPTNITATILSLRPMAPAITSVVAMSSTQVTIMWTPSINSSTTAPVTSWTVLYSCYSPWNLSSCLSGSITSSSTSSSITGLKKGSRYTFVVFGVNSGGVGDVSLPATNQTLVDPPTIVVGLNAIVMTTTSVSLTWTPPADNGGQNISHYVIQYGFLDGNYLTNISNTTTMATQILLSGLTENSWYLFSVAAHNGFAVGDVSSQIKLLVGYPIKPASVRAPVITDTYVNITWQLQNPAGFIDYFILSYRLESSQTWKVAAPILSNGTLNYLLTGLSPNTTYVVGVATKNGLLNPSNYTTVTFTTAAKPYVTGPQVIYAGVPFSITCNLAVGFPGQITWSRLGSSIPSSASSVGNNLNFTNPQPGDSGNYTCGYVNSSATSTSQTITIQPLTPSVSGPGDTVTPGTKFNLTCNVGTGYSTSVVWSKDGSLTLPMNAMASGNVLIFTNPQPADSGKYTCSFLGFNGPVSEAFVVSIEEQSDIMSIEEVAIISTVTTFLVAFALGAAAMGVIVCIYHCCSRHWAESKATISGDHLTMEANTAYSLQKRNNASGEIGYTGDQEQDTAMEVNCAYATFKFNENNEIETY